ncbi:hypothetical protein C9374_004520 [Naegleria lovaniensis]|uniref:Guanine nucleotide-binding protein subunit beta-like protein n=1 Tax=Naegleria lovaniensis TaxID=51637 RepID=A0AA88GRI8_NAELO|nr:uncharacterized protein C9374_004520 [Naegleria lovaniensis]KAG2383183.1 hypothetical protein C9374_004520 [Naegleria lovaniensis]
MLANNLSSDDPTLERTYRGHHGTITGLSFCPSMKRMASVAMDSTLYIWNFKPNLRSYKYQQHEKGGVMCVEFSPLTGKLVATGGRDKTIRLWQPTIEGKSTVIRGHTNTVRSVHFSMDGKRLLSSSDDKTIKLWSIANQQFIQVFSGHSNWVRATDFSPDERLIVSGSDDKTVRLWDIKSNKCIMTLVEHADNVNDVHFSPDGNCLVSCSVDKTVKVWDVRLAKKLLQHFTGHEDTVNQVSYHPSGDYIISCSTDQTMKIWDTREGRLFYTISGHASPTTAVTFSPLGQSMHGMENKFRQISSNYLFENNLSPPFSNVNTYAGIEEDQMAERLFMGTAGHSERPTSAPAQPRSTVPVANGKQSSSTFVNSQPPGATFSKLQTTNSAAGSSFPPQQSPQVANRQQPPQISSVSNFQSVYFPPPIQTDNIPPSLANTLEHILRQLDIITQTVKVMEDRLTLTEHKLSKMEINQKKIIQMELANQIAHMNHVQQQQLFPPQSQHNNFQPNSTSFNTRLQETPILGPTPSLTSSPNMSNSSQASSQHSSPKPVINNDHEDSHDDNTLPKPRTPLSTVNLPATPIQLSSPLSLQQDKQ